MDLNLALATVWYVVFIISLTFHEAAHAFVAHKFGDPTAYYQGQVTLDPIPHIRRSPVGMVIVPIVSFIIGGWMIGWASAPYDPYWADSNRRKAALMALAGHFGYSPDKTAVEAVINGPVFSSDAKSVKKVWNNREYSNTNRQVRTDFSTEIEDALYWAEGLTGDKSDSLQIPLFSSPM